MEAGEEGIDNYFSEINARDDSSVVSKGGIKNNQYSSINAGDDSSVISKGGITNTDFSQLLLSGRHGALHMHICRTSFHVISARR